jgi:YVTN family beta-propeller protein
VGLSPAGVTVAVVAGLAIALGAAFVTGFLAPPGSPSAASPPATTAVLARSPAASVAVSSGRGWIADDQAGEVLRFDTSSGGLTGRAVRTGGTPIALTSGFGRLWVADISRSVLYVIDPATGKEDGAPITVAQGPVSVAAGEGGIWVASLLSGTVSLVDPHTLQVTASVALPGGAVRVTLGGGYVWVTGQSDTLARIDPHALGVTLEWRAVKVGQGPIGVAFGAGKVWVANAQSGTVSEVNPRTLSLSRGFRVPSGSSNTPSSNSDPEQVAFWKGLVWVGVGSRPALLAFDPRSGSEVGKPVTLPGAARDLYVADDGSFWATTSNPGTAVMLSGR